MTTKTKLRKLLKTVQTNNREIKSKEIENLLLSLISRCKKIGIYCPIFDEVELKQIICNKNFELYAPSIEGCLVFRKIDQKGFKISHFGIDEPLGEIVDSTSLDAIIIPCLGASYSGYRLGYGKGYYDAYLKDYQKLKIGVCYSNHLIEEDFHQPHDVRLDYLVTEKGIIKVKNNV